jgi:CubicO group peptidase (beta-lactamase class C family)
VSLRHLLTMTSGVRWNETYADPSSDRRRMLDAQLGQQPGAILRLMASLPRAHAPGTTFNYSTGETHVVGAVLRHAVGAPVAQYLSDRIWAPFGMEADAAWWLESPDGLEVAGSGLSARLRDFARFGLFILQGGVAGGREVLPAHWLSSATRDQVPAGHALPYGYMWWPLPDAAGPMHRGAFRAIGIFGQQLYIHPVGRVVITQFSALPQAIGAWSILPEDCYGAMLQALRG